MKTYNLCIVGATGLVGSTFIKVLEEYNFPINKLKLLASSRSAGKVITVMGKDHIVEELTEDSFDGYDIALFSAGATTSKLYAPIASSKGVIVIDNSSAFRQDNDKALVVPEINIETSLINNIIANPNCSTIQAVMPLKAISDKWGIKRVNYTTFQAVSGSGINGKLDLEKTLSGEEKEFYPHNISKTCIPQIDKFMENSYTYEEMKMVNETKKILSNDDLLVSATCVRVPIMNCHAVQISVELNKEFTLSDIKKCLNSFDGITVLDDDENYNYPTAEVANGTDQVYVGRIRRDLANENGLLLYTVADNIRKGAASNAVQIALKLIEKGMI